MLWNDSKRSLQIDGFFGEGRMPEYPETPPPSPTPSSDMHTRAREHVYMLHLTHRSLSELYCL